MAIPVTSSRVNIANLDPLLRYRVDLMLNDPEMKGYRVVSGVRTKKQQIALWNGWRSRLPGYNLAANPYNTIGTTVEGWTFYGSYHMQQVDGYGHAVDLRRPFTHSRARASALIGRIGKRYGLVQVALGAGGDPLNEWWHLQARTTRGYFSGPTLPTSLDGGASRMLISYGFYTWLNEGWRYRQLSSPDSVKAFKDGGVPHVNLSDEKETLRALLNEAKTAGRLIQSTDADKLLDTLNGE